MRSRRRLAKSLVSFAVTIGVVAALLRVAEPTRPAPGRPAWVGAAIDGPDQVVKPTMVSLDFRNRPMSEVIQVLSARTGSPFRIYEARTDWLATRVTIREPIALPFWQAVDRLCAVGQFQWNVSLESVNLFRDYVIGPTSDYGAFRVQLRELAYGGRVQYPHLASGPASGPFPKDGDQSVIELHIIVEPRMMIRNNGELKSVKVIDDLGQSLLGPSPEPEQPAFDFGYTTAGFVLATIPLGRLDRPGQVIRTLSGAAPVAAAAGRPNPLVIPLAGAAGRSFDSGESVLTIRKVLKVHPDPKVTFEPFDPVKRQLKPLPAIRDATGIVLTIRSSGPRPAGEGSQESAPLHRCFNSLSEYQFQVVDAAGHVWTPFPWWMSNQPPARQDGETHVFLNLVDANLSPWPWRDDLTGAKLLFYDLVEVEVDVPFSFHDIALP
jgi:hypothetical protein